MVVMTDTLQAREANLHPKSGGFGGQTAALFMIQHNPSIVQAL